MFGLYANILFVSENYLFIGNKTDSSDYCTVMLGLFASKFDSYCVIGSPQYNEGLFANSNQLIILLMN